MSTQNHLSAARSLIRTAMSTPDRAAALLDEATWHIDRALAGVTEATPELEARRVVAACEELFAIMACFEEAA